METLICNGALSRPAVSIRALWRLAALAGVCALAACGSVQKDPTAKWDAEHLYKEAHTELTASNWSHARELFEKLESRYPFGRYAQQGQIEIAYTYYKEGETADALDATERFLKANPSHPNVDYVYYLKGLINFIEPPALIGRLVGYKVSERDPKAMRDSFEAFKELVSRFPDSRYAPDARVRLRYLQNALAGHEVRVGGPAGSAQVARAVVPGAWPDGAAGRRRTRASAELSVARRRQEPLKNRHAVARSRVSANGGRLSRTVLP
jgi:outer membrane protein assembly factor BamD